MAPCSATEFMATETVRGLHEIDIITSVEKEIIQTREMLIWICCFRGFLIPESLIPSSSLCEVSTAI
ncbi:hypothetical protein X798_02885 [Onchocerca flexuosa]|uniref:Ovule protein n=2 Tax=Onchocerca flexuosa TaxID=387005 RepID=A0A183H6X5_9BILA|nr:hypothetical protein X798_02885 [Onchocerca flexuosa]VDO35768.1 unnamed protein product [Onchocerca flexuosa]